MPMRGGCVMHLRHLDKITHCEPGRVVVEPGCLLKDVDAHCIAGGSGSVGSVTWGSLCELGNIIRLRVVTMEEEPRVLEFTGEELARFSHAYSTNGIITELELGRALIIFYELYEALMAVHDLMHAEVPLSDLRQTL